MPNEESGEAGLSDQVTAFDNVIFGDPGDQQSKPEAKAPKEVAKKAATQEETETPEEPEVEIDEDEESDDQHDADEDSDEEHDDEEESESFQGEEDEDEDSDESDDPRIEALERQLEEQRQQNAAIMKMMENFGSKGSQEEPSGKMPKSGFSVSDPEVPALSEEEFESVTTDPKAFNEYMRKIALANQQAVYLRVPEIVRSTQAAQRVVDDFFAENKDLNTKAARTMVETNAINLSRGNPSLSPQDALTQAGALTRELMRGLGARQPQPQPKGNKSKRRNKPKFAKGNRQRAGAPASAKPTKDNRTAQQKQMDALEQHFS